MVVPLPSRPRPAALGALAELLAPARCPGCGGAGATALCPPCAARVAATVGPRCPRCGAEAGSDATCAPRGAPAQLAVAWSYRDVVARAVVAAKLRGARASWPGLARAAVTTLAPALGTAVGVGAAAVVPVPTDPARRRRRGHDHALVLASVVAEAVGLPVADLLRVDPGASRAAGRSAPRRSGRGARAGVRDGGRPGARAVAPPRMRAVRRLPPVGVLLVDDVVTSGVTLVAATTALHRAGATRVDAVAMARAHGAGRSDGRSGHRPAVRWTAPVPVVVRAVAQRADEVAGRRH